MNQQQEEGFIGSRLKHIPLSQLLFSTHTQLLLLTKRQIIRLDAPSQTLVYSNIEDQKVIHTTHHTSLEVYSLLTDRNIVFINQQGELIKKIYNQTLNGAQCFFVISMNDGYKGVPNNRDDFGIYVKGDYLYTATAKVYYERQMIKSKGICDLGMQLQNSQMVESPQFIQHTKFIIQVSMLIVWNTKETYIYKTPRSWQEKFQRLYIYNKISKRQNLSLDYAVSLALKTLAVGFESGVIKIFLLDQSKKYLLDLKGHQVACTSLFVSISNPYLLYSASPDSTVRIWNLRDYEQVYMLQLDLLVKSIKFVSDSLLFLTTDQLKTKSYLCQINTSLLDPIVNDNRSGQLIKMRCDQDWCISIFSNQLIEFMSNNNLHQNLENQKVQFPLQYGTIKDVFRLENDLYAVALDRGFSLITFDKKEIKGENFDLKKLIYNESIIRKKAQNANFIELIHQKLLDTFIFNAISDWKQIPTAIILTSLYFHKNKWLPLWNLTTYQKSKSTSLPVTYCLLGCSKGQIYFVDISKKSQYSTKIHLHSQAISLIRQIKQPTDHFSSFLSVSIDRQITIWNLSHRDTPSPLFSLTYNRKITYIELFDNYLLIGEKQGDFNILKIEVSETKVKMFKSTNTNGHLRSVICGDHLHYKQTDLFLSGGEDSVIKIWKGVQKQLIFHLKLFGIVNTVNFIHNKLNLIVCHNQQISFIKQDKLKSLTKAYNNLNNPHKQSKQTVQTMNIKQFFIEEPVSPLSPFKRGGMHRYNTRYAQLFRKSSKIEQNHFMLTKNDEEDQIRFSSLRKNPKSVSFLQEAPKRQKIKRFHAFSIDEFNQQLTLPRIHIRKPAAAQFPLLKKDHQLITQLKQARNKSLSNAGRKPY